MLTWDEICADPALQDLPYKIETNHYGQIVMSPAKGWHSERQYLIQQLLGELLPAGKPLPEAPVATAGGVKVADVGWFSKERLAPVRRESAYSIAPEICVEVLSDSNSAAELTEKAALYFATGADEFWTCDDAGGMLFYLKANPGQAVAASQRCPAFPSKLDLDWT